MHTRQHPTPARLLASPPRLRAALAAAIAMTAAAGCGDDSSAPPTDGTTTAPTTALTWTSDIQSIVARRCAGCHVPGGVAPFPLTTYEEVAAVRSAVAFSVESGSMPPVLTDPDCQPYANDYRLPSDERAALLEWLSDDALLVGDLEGFEPTMPTLDTLSDADTELTFEAPYTPNATALDDYHCLPFGEAFEEDTWVTAHEFIPDAQDLVHHTILYLVPPSGVAAMEAEDAASPGPGYPCYGTSGHGGQPMGVWAPGGGPQRFPSGSAFALPAGARIVAQMHYNTASGNLRPDQSRLKLATTRAAPPLRVTMPIFNGFFEIPAGQTQSFDFSHTFSPDMPEQRIFAIMPHMHTIGQQLSAEIAHPEGSSQCLTRVTEWDFEWQQFYALEDADVTVRGGDELRYRCTFDNSSGDAPVAFGEGTEDEMCLVVMAMVGPPPPEDQGPLCADYDACRQQCQDPSSSTCYLDCVQAQPDACQGCLLQGVGECGQTHCGETGGALFECMSSNCAVDLMDTEGIFACFQGACSAPFEAQWGCLAPNMEDGTCDAQFNACGVVP